MQTQDFSNAELFFLIDAVNSRPGKISKTATLDNIAEFEAAFLLRCVERKRPRSSADYSARQTLMIKLGRAIQYAPLQRCAHTRTKRNPAGRLYCRDCHRLVD
jgi:hypothetical protein